MSLLYAGANLGSIVLPYGRTISTIGADCHHKDSRNDGALMEICVPDGASPIPHNESFLYNNIITIVILHAYSLLTRHDNNLIITVDRVRMDGNPCQYQCHDIVLARSSCFPRACRHRRACDGRPAEGAFPATVITVTVTVTVTVCS